MEQKLVLDREKQIMKAEQAFALGKYDLAIKFSQQMLAEDPEDAHAYWLMSRCYLVLEEYEQALATIEETLKLIPEDSDAHALYGSILFKLNRKKEAEEEYNRAIELDPHSFFSRFVYAEYLGIYHDRNKEGLYQIEQALQIDPTDADALSIKGVILGKLKKHKQAEQAFQESLTQEPENDNAHHNYGRFLLFRNRPQQAYRHLKEAIRLDPESSLTRDLYQLCIKVKHPLFRWVWVYQLFIDRFGWMKIGLFFLALGIFLRAFAWIFFIFAVAFFIFVIIYAGVVGSYLDSLIKRGRLK